MATTFTDLNYHIVFSTKGRKPLIKLELRPHLYPYLAGIIKGERGVLDEVGGMTDHIHLLVRWRPDVSVSKLVQTIKSKPSGWIHREYDPRKVFGWQDAYAAFTVSESQCTKVSAYIRSQEKHHAKRDFKQELVALLESHGIQYDPRYICRRGGVLRPCGADSRGVMIREFTAFTPGYSPAVPSGLECVAGNGGIDARARVFVFETEHIMENNWFDASTWTFAFRT